MPTITELRNAIITDEYLEELGGQYLPSSDTDESKAYAHLKEEGKKRRVYTTSVLDIEKADDVQKVLGIHTKNGEKPPYIFIKKENSNGQSKLYDCKGDGTCTEIKIEDVKTFEINLRKEIVKNYAEAIIKNLISSNGKLGNNKLNDKNLEESFIKSAIEKINNIKDDKGNRVQITKDRLTTALVAAADVVLSKKEEKQQVVKLTETPRSPSPTSPKESLSSSSSSSSPTSSPKNSPNSSPRNSQSPSPKFSTKVQGVINDLATVSKNKEKWSQLFLKIKNFDKTELEKFEMWFANLSSNINKKENEKYKSLFERPNFIDRRIYGDEDIEDAVKIRDCIKERIDHFNNLAIKKEEEEKYASLTPLQQCEAKLQSYSKNKTESILKDAVVAFNKLDFSTQDKTKEIFDKLSKQPHLSTLIERKKEIAIKAEHLEFFRELKKQNPNELWDDRAQACFNLAHPDNVIFDSKPDAQKIADAIALAVQNNKDDLVFLGVEIFPGQRLQVVNGLIEVYRTNQDAGDRSKVVSLLEKFTYKDDSKDIQSNVLLILTNHYASASSNIEQKEINNREKIIVGSLIKLVDLHSKKKTDVPFSLANESISKFWNTAAVQQLIMCAFDEKSLSKTEPAADSVQKYVIKMANSFVGEYKTENEKDEFHQKLFNRLNAKSYSERKFLVGKDASFVYQAFKDYVVKNYPYVPAEWYLDAGDTNECLSQIKQKPELVLLSDMLLKLVKDKSQEQEVKAIFGKNCFANATVQVLLDWQEKHKSDSSDLGKLIYKQVWLALAGKFQADFITTENCQTVFADKELRAVWLDVINKNFATLTPDQQKIFCDFALHENNKNILSDIITAFSNDNVSLLLKGFKRDDVFEIENLFDEKAWMVLADKLQNVKKQGLMSQRLEENEEEKKEEKELKHSEDSKETKSTLQLKDFITPKNCDVIFANENLRKVWLPIIKEGFSGLPEDKQDIVCYSAIKSNNEMVLSDIIAKQSSVSGNPLLNVVLMGLGGKVENPVTPEQAVKVLKEYFQWYVLCNDDCLSIIFEILNKSAGAVDKGLLDKVHLYMWSAQSPQKTATTRSDELWDQYSSVLERINEKTLGSFVCGNKVHLDAKRAYALFESCKIPTLKIKIANAILSANDFLDDKKEELRTFVENNSQQINISTPEIKSLSSSPSSSPLSSSRSLSTSPSNVATPSMPQDSSMMTTRSSNESLPSTPISSSSRNSSSSSLSSLEEKNTVDSSVASTRSSTPESSVVADSNSKLLTNSPKTPKSPPKPLSDVSPAPEKKSWWRRLLSGIAIVFLAVISPVTAFMAVIWNTKKTKGDTKKPDNSSDAGSDKIVINTLAATNTTKNSSNHSASSSSASEPAILVQVQGGDDINHDPLPTQSLSHRTQQQQQQQQQEHQSTLNPDAVKVVQQTEQHLSPH